MGGSMQDCGLCEKLFSLYNVSIGHIAEIPEKEYYTHQNGVEERKNRTIMGAARAMLQDQGLPMH